MTATISNSLGLVAGQPDRRDRLPARAARPAAAAAPAAARLGARRADRAFLLLHLPASTFEAIVPGLVALAVVLVAAQPLLQRRLAARRARPATTPSRTSGRGRLAALFAGAYATGTYGGYFAASQGVLQIGIFGLLLRESAAAAQRAQERAHPRGQRGRRRWPTSSSPPTGSTGRPPALVAAGSLVGGYAGLALGRRLPAPVLRTAIVAARGGRHRGAGAPVSALEFALLVVAGIGAGLAGSIAGLASLISYPALLATGLPPVTANVTNTVALVLNGVGSVSASRPELTGQGRRLLPLGSPPSWAARSARRCCCSPRRGLRADGARS